MFYHLKFYTKRENAGIFFAFVVASLLCVSAGCTNMTSEGRNHLGVQYYKQARYDQAITEFQNAVNQNPDSPEGYYNIGLTYHTLGAADNNAAYYGQAEQYYKLCLTKNPNYAPCREKYAELMLETGRTTEAFTFLNDWESAHKDSSSPKIAMAKLYLKADRPQNALVYLDAAVQKDPKNPDIYNLLGNLRESLGESSQALENYRVSYQLNPHQKEIADKIEMLETENKTTIF